MNGEIKYSVLEAIKFYGSIISTNGIDEETKKLANKNVKRLVDALATNVDELVAELSGIQL